MIRSLWIARTGLDAQQTSLDVIANNLANVSTNGFKRARAVFEDLLYQTMRQPGAQSSQSTQIPSGLQLGTGVRRYRRRASTRRARCSRPATIWTWRSTAPASSGLLPDGTTAYTRDGAFQKDNQGQLVTSSGYPVQPNITIPADALDRDDRSKDGVVR
jgi:flagellar basal-body rod protein FlgG